ncbi:MAG: hypothetical protein NTY53_26860 [Kiritimatiellaeota bacterium]|nr:hypothetical protein [Kiritimatiellota bacterium]
MKIIASILFAISLSSVGWAVEVREQNHVVSIANAAVSVSYDLAKGTYSASDVKRGKVIISDAVTKLDTWSSAGAAHTFVVEPLGDALGLGKSVLITSAVAGGPKLLLRISLYDGGGFIALAAGLENTTGAAIQLKDIAPLEGVAFAGGELQNNFSLLDGFSGGVKTYVTHDGRRRKSLNNMLATFGARGANRSLVLGGLSYAEFEKYAVIERGKSALAIRLAAGDPIGKRIEPGTRYLVEKDRFYLDFMTDNPFDALEAYANAVRLAQPVVLPVCRFPIVDTWFAQVPHFGGGEDRAGYRAQNDSVGAVEEMECVVRSGFLKYSTVAVLIEPDLYDLNNQQGWWDDEHWQRGPSNRAKKTGTWVSSHGQFVPPFETARQWCGAIKALGGVPMIYIQTGFRSQDYAEKFPEHMLFNEANAPHVNEKGEQLYRDKGKKEPRKLGYDYTDPGFIRHVRAVWENLRLAGLQGVKFDYPDFPFTGWPTRGGMEDKYATTAMHYRNIFRLAQEGLGPDCYLHERALDRGSEITLGLVTSQRTEGDTDNLNPGMVARVGLRWYKNRTLLNYDMDGKNPFHAVPANRDGERAMLTMSYVVSGSLIIVPSFGRMTTNQLFDLSRIYPFHAQRQSARPVDAFTIACPRVYDFMVNEQWHQLTFYNTDATNSATIAVDLAGDSAFGALGLDPAKQYFVFDFWNDAFLGKFAGGQKFEQTLRPGEARMMAVHEVTPHPQFLATDRHVMQGLVDLTGCAWDEKKHQLRGVANVVVGEPYRIIIVTNGQKPNSAARCGRARKRRNSSS